MRCATGAPRWWTPEPAEFAEATIPGAVNVPIFDNAERAAVGTVYKEEGKNAARRLAVKLVAPKIPEFSREVANVLKAAALRWSFSAGAAACEAMP